MMGRARFLPLMVVLLAATSSALADDSDTESTIDSTADGSCRYLDAAVRWYGTLYLFSGNEYLALDDYNNESYVADIADWDDLPADIDAAFQWSGNYAYYFMKGEDYYKYVAASLAGPWSSPYYWDSYFLGGIDAAANRRGETYFFKGSTFTIWYNDYYGISQINQIPPPLPHDIDAAFDKNDDWETMILVKGDKMWEWGPSFGEVYGPVPVSDFYTLRSWTLCPYA